MEMIKSDNVYKYANLKLHELDTLNEVRYHLQELYDLKKDGYVEGVDIDGALEKMKRTYNEMLNIAKEESIE